MEIIFNDAEVARLAKAAKLPPDANMAALAKGVRDAAHIFARDTVISAGNELHNEIAELLKAADRHRYDEVAACWKAYRPRR